MLSGLATSNTLGTEWAPGPFTADSKGPSLNGGLHFPKINYEFSQGTKMASIQPEAWDPVLCPQESILTWTPTWPESENSDGLPGVLGGRPPSSEVLQPLPG